MHATTSHSDSITQRPWFAPLALLGLLLIAGCGLAGNDDSNTTDTFDAGPILFVYQQQLWSMEEDGSGIKQLTHDPDFPVFDAKWSPDGGKIAINGLANPTDKNEFARAVYVINADGTGRRKLTHPPLGLYRYWGDIDRRFTWSPDGTRIAFSRMRPPEGLGIFDVLVVDIESGRESVVSYSNWLEYVDDWHPLREELIVNYSYSDSITFMQGTLAFVNLNGEYVEVLGKLDSHYNQARISPDGSKLAYTKAGKLYLFDFEANTEVLLSDLPQFPAPSAWSPSGDRLIFQILGSTYEKWKIYLIHIETGEITDITPFSSPGTEIWLSSWRKTTVKN